MAKRILILGAGVYQVPLIDAARNRGLETIVASRSGPYPGIALADTFVPVDIADYKGILAVAREYAIDAVVTTGADAGMLSLGMVADALNLYGPDEASAFRSANKVSMKASFIKGHVPSGRFRFFTKIEPAREFAAEIGFPVIVKPPDSSGSRGVSRVDDDDGFASSWQEALSHARTKGVIVEQYLVGREYGAQAVVHGDYVAAVFIHDDMVTRGPVSTPVGHAMPTTLTASEIIQTEQVVTNAVAAMCLRDCVANVDLMLTDDGPQVIEIGGRMGATGIPEMINLYTGWNIYDHVVDLSLGNARPLPDFKSRPNAVTLLRSDRAGVITSLEVPPEVRDHPQLVDIRWDVKSGDEVPTFKVGPDRIGQLQVTGETTAAAVQLAETLRSGLKINVQESS